MPKEKAIESTDPTSNQIKDFTAPKIKHAWRRTSQDSKFYSETQIERVGSPILLKSISMPDLGAKDVILLPRGLQYLHWRPKKLKIGRTNSFLLNEVVQNLPTALRGLSMQYIKLELPIAFPTTLTSLTIPYPYSTPISLKQLPR